MSFPSSTTPPLQDHLDRFLGPSTADVVHAPNTLARLRAESALFGGFGGGGGGALLPISVRPPIDKHYKQVGVLVRNRADGSDVSNADLDILPLMGQLLHGGTGKHRYFAKSHGVGTNLPVVRAAECPTGQCGNGIGASRRGKCTSEYGCDELYSDDLVKVPGFQDAFKVNIFDNGTFFS